MFEKLLDDSSQIGCKSEYKVQTLPDSLAKKIDGFPENQEWLENVTSGDYQKYYNKQYSNQ